MDLNTSTAIESVVGTDAPSNVRPLAVHADLINSDWRKGAEAIIECGRHLAEARAEHSRAAFDAMVKNKLDFDSSVARKLMCIAANETLCAPGAQLPPNWTIIYELSKLPASTLKAAFADGRIHPGMSRRDALALKPPKKTTVKPTAAKPPLPANSAELTIALWESFPKDQRRTLLDELGREGLCAVMSPALLVELRDYVIRLAVVGASNSTTNFARYGTDKLHSLLSCAEQPEPDTERIVALLNCIIKNADDKGIARSNIVIAEGKPKSRK